MSTLEAKFEALELQLTTQQSDVINALNAILEALGAPPPTATATLADTNLILTAISENLIGMRSENTDFYAALLDSVGQINVNTDTLINNSSLNAQRTIAAILATYCPCTTDAPLLPPVIDVTPTEVVDDAKCRRIQFYLSLFSTWLFDVANYGSSGAAVTGDVLFSLLSAAGAAVGLVATGAEVGAAAGIPGAVVGAIVGLIVGAIYFVGGSQLVNYANDFGSPVVQADLLAALYAATTADEGQTAFQVTVGAHFDPIPAGIINALWWSAWSNDLYSGSPTVDDSGFDGSICAPESTCHTYVSTTVDSDYGPGATVVVDTSPLSGETQGHYAGGQKFMGDFYGWTVTPTNSNLYLQIDSSGNMNLTAPYTFTTHTTYFFPNGIAPFEFELCQP